MPAIFALLLISGFASANTWCYQETATTATGCGGLATGSYSIEADWNNPTYAYDGDLGTYAEGYTGGDGYGLIYITYSKPTGATSSSIWQLKDGTQFANFSIPAACWNYNANNLYLVVYTEPGSNYMTWECYTSVFNTVVVASGATKRAYEEGMWWDVPSAPAAPSLFDIDLQNNTINVNGTAIIFTDIAANSTALANNFTSNIWVNNSGTNITFNTSSMGNKYQFFNGTGAWVTFTGLTVASPPDYSTSGYCLNATNTPGNWTGSGGDCRAWTNNPTATNTCTYGGTGNWIINLADSCVITTSWNIGANYFYYNGTGMLTFYNLSSRIIISGKGERFSNATAPIKIYHNSSVWKNFTG